MSGMIIPSFLSEYETPFEDDGGAFTDNLLRIGEVTKVIYPDDPQSLSKRFIEYSVQVQKRANGTAGVVEYRHCYMANPLSGLADYAWWRLRVDKNHQAGKDGNPGQGSKVLILCINGERMNPVILCGIRDEADLTEEKSLGRDKGHAAEFMFNGLKLAVADDGSLEIRYGGPTKADGTLDTDKVKAAQVGTYVKIANDGTLTLAAKELPKDAAEDAVQQRVVMDNTKKTIEVHADTEWKVIVKGESTIQSGKNVTVKSLKGNVMVRADAGNITLSAPKGKLFLGAEADESAVLGDTLKGLIDELIVAIKTMTVYTAVGTSSPAVNQPAFDAVKSKLSNMLSKYAFVRKKPG